MDIHQSSLDVDISWIYIGYMSKEDTPQRRHSASILLRVLPEHAELMQEAADHAGISRSDWMRERLLRCAREELEKK